jgi:hypothetical protein
MRTNKQTCVSSLAAYYVHATNRRGVYVGGPDGGGGYHAQAHYTVSGHFLPLRRYLCLIFCYHSAGTRTDVFGIQHSAEFLPRHQRISDEDFSWHVCDTHVGVSYLGCFD